MADDAMLPDLDFFWDPRLTMGLDHLPLGGGCAAATLVLGGLALHLAVDPQRR